MNILKKENDSLRRELYKNDDYSNNLGLEDNTNENKRLLEKYKDEIKVLNNQLEEHKKCLRERNSLEKEHLQLKNRLQELKKNIKNIKIDIKERGSIEINNNSLPLETNEDTSSNNNASPKNNNINNNTKTIPNQRNKTSLKHKKLPRLNLSKSIDGVKLPLITSPSNANFVKNDKNILTEEFYSKLKKFYSSNENEYEILEKKIQKYYY